MPSTRLASVLAALVPLADALTISTATLARPGVSSELSWAAALVNRDVMSDDAAAMPPLPRMEVSPPRAGSNASAIFLFLFPAHRRLSPRAHPRSLPTCRCLTWSCMTVSAQCSRSGSRNSLRATRCLALATTTTSSTTRMSRSSRRPSSADESLRPPFFGDAGPALAPRPVYLDTCSTESEGCSLHCARTIGLRESLSSREGGACSRPPEMVDLRVYTLAPSERARVEREVSERAEMRAAAKTVTGMTTHSRHCTHLILDP